MGRRSSFKLCEALSSSPLSYVIVMICGLPTVRATMRISESEKNPGKLYYDCPREKDKGKLTFGNVNGHDGIKLFKIVNPLEVENSEKVLHQREQKLSPSESLEPRRASYLRKSLAWDNAFFTCTVLINYLLNTFLHTPRGVLDPEELCAMNKGFKRRESFLFPGIQEDLKIA